MNTSEEAKLLRSVSRSFYLSIRALPRALRPPVALGYLLARLTDTVADTATIDVALRRQMLVAAVSAIQGKENGAAEKLREQFAPEQTNAAERALMVAFDFCLEKLNALSSDDRADVRALLAVITRGQQLDLARWPGEPSALANAAELKEYTYLVAGCVGEFWTRLCFRKLPAFTARDQSDMMELARQYGSGLQLVNIVRDAGDDLRAGRCYFPEDELRDAGLSVAQLKNAPDDFLPVYQRWIEEARKGLEAGLEYSIAIDPPRVRIATVLPALIGVRTLELLDASGLSSLRERVKVPRAEIRQMMASATITLANRTRLRSMRARL